MKRKRLGTSETLPSLPLPFPQRRSPGKIRVRYLGDFIDLDVRSGKAKELAGFMESKVVASAERNDVGQLRFPKFFRVSNMVKVNILPAETDGTIAANLFGSLPPKLFPMIAPKVNVVISQPFRVRQPSSFALAHGSQRNNPDPLAQTGVGNWRPDVTTPWQEFRWFATPVRTGRSKADRVTLRTDAGTFTETASLVK
jgi:hypothetical protein